MARLVSLTVLTVLIVFLGITFFQVVAPFLLPLFLAGVMAILCQPIYRHFLERTGNRVRISAGLTTFLVLFTLLVPLLLGTVIGALQLYTIAANTLASERFAKGLETVRAELRADELLERFQAYVPPEMTSERLQQNTRQFVQSIAERTLGLAGTTINRTLGLLGAVVSLTVGLLMFTIALYYFLADGPAMLRASEELIPVHVTYQRELLSQFEKVVRAVVMATFFAAVAQGLLTSAALWAAGWWSETPALQHAVIFFIIATISALIPLAGTWLVWGPCAIWLMMKGDWVAGTALALFGGLVIGTLDNVIRAFILHSDAKLHPLLAFVSVLGGLQVMGLWGVFIGPIVASCLHALIQIFNTELREFSRSRALQMEGAVPPEAMDASPPAIGPPLPGCATVTIDAVSAVAPVPSGAPGNGSAASVPTAAGEDSASPRATGPGAVAIAHATATPAATGEAAVEERAPARSDQDRLAHQEGAPPSGTQKTTRTVHRKRKRSGKKR